MRIIITTIVFLFFLTKSFAQTTDSSLKITQLSGDFYIYTTYNLYKGNRIPANGMYLITNDGAVMFDTPWDTTQFQPLLDSIMIKHNKKVILCIATHFHEDRTYGLEYYRQHGIKTFTTKQTDDLSKERGKKRAEFLIYKDSIFNAGQYFFQTYYPGGGHTADNIVIWFEKEKILYGGCLIKSVEADDLGYLGDASVKDYAASVKHVQEKCKNPKFVIPGHDDWTNIKSLEHTYKMAKELRKKNKG
ncbi:MAG: BlaB/IND/MUS family subclass B1 metallo-beta-lactamase [Ferruginibacter sp.]